jgi:hypothetical protein
MKSIQQALDEKRDSRKRAKGEPIGPPVLVIQAKGNMEIRVLTDRYQRRGYVLESAEAQGRKRVVLTFRLPPAASGPVLPPGPE